MASRRTFHQSAGAAGIFLLIGAIAFAGQSGESRLDEAGKVLKAIEKIKAETSGGRTGNERSVALGENDLNAYFAYRIETEKQSVLKELRLKIFDQNRLEGKIFIDLSGLDIPSFIKPRMNVLFSADLVAGGGRGKLDIKELYIEDQKIQPLILDGILRLAAKAGGLEPVGLEDWFDLPYGIVDIKTRKGSAVFFY